MGYAFNNNTKQLLTSADPNNPVFAAPEWFIAERPINPAKVAQIQALLGAGVPPKYMKVIAGDILEMTAGEKAAVDATDLQALKRQAVANLHRRIADYLESRGYPNSTVALLYALLAEARVDTNAARVTYLTPIKAWHEAILDFQRTRRNLIVAAAGPAGVVAALTFNLSNLFDAPGGSIAVDPELTLEQATNIP